jgi:hypothetical protein
VASQCRKLRSLNVELCRKITDRSVQAVARSLPDLVCFNCGGCAKVTNVGVSLLCDHQGKQLLRLNLGGCKLTDYDTEDIGKACISLQELVGASTRHCMLHACAYPPICGPCS